MPFPAPDDLALLKPDELRALGFSRQKGQAIITLARAVAAGHVHLDELESLDDAAAVARLRTLRGVGRWTAEYVLLRGLGRLHVFPGDDVGAATTCNAGSGSWSRSTTMVCATGARPMAALPGPLLWDLGNRRRGCANSVTACCAERALREGASPC
jgi:3-methyladenine DNA glycosylase/8-oxoguanine DNA glycosylase